MNIKELEIGATETLEILNNFSKSDVKKIAPGFMKLLKENEKEEYKKEFDFSVPLENLNLNINTKLILGIIYRMFWADVDEKKEFDLILNDNEIIYEKELKEKYENKDLFTKSSENQENVVKDVDIKINKNENNSNLLSKQEEKWYEKIIKKIKNLVRKVGKNE